MRIEAWTLLSISTEGVRETLARLETLENSTES